VLDLATAQRRALQDNPTLQAAAERVAQARERVKQSRSAWLPQVDATWSATKVWISDNSFEAAQFAAIQQAQLFRQPVASALSGVDDSFKTYDAGIVASYLIFDGFSRRYTHAMAKFGRGESEAGSREAKRLILDAVAQSFYGVQLARENVDIALADEAFNQRLLQEAKARQRVGAGSLSDVLNFEIRLRAASAAALRGEEDYAVARIALAALMGLPEATLPADMTVARLRPETPGHLENPPEDGAIEKALTLRPDLEQTRLGVKRAQANVGRSRSAFYPRLSAFASKSASRSDDSDFENDDFATTMGLNFSLNLFAGGRNRAALAESKHARNESERYLQNLQIQVTSEVHRALVQLRTTQAQLLLQRDTAEYVEQNRDLVEKEYQAGGRGASLARLNQAQRDLTEAQGRLVQARVALQSAWHTLHTATAETLSDLD
jgi:outer membrane protein TolC